MTREPVAPGLFRDDTAEPVLLLGMCSGCGHLSFPAADTCPLCWEPCQQREGGRRGRLRLVTSVQRPPPGYAGPVPYALGIVEIDEGLCVVSRIAGGAVEDLALGTPVALGIEVVARTDDGRERTCWCFTPEAR